MASDELERVSDTSRNMRGHSATPTVDLLSAIIRMGALPQALRWDAERTVEFARGIFPGDHLGQLDGRFFVEETTHIGEESVVNIAIGERHRVRVA